MIKPVACCISFILLFYHVTAQQKAFIRLNQPAKEYNQVNASRQYIIGSTCKGCLLTLNGQDVKVYPTGGFAIQLDLQPGDTTFLLSAYMEGSKAVLKNLYYQYALPPLPKPDTTFSISSISTYPEGNLQLSPGDQIAVRIKALPGCKASWLDGRPLYELPPGAADGMPGIYQATYTVQQNDPLIHGNIKITLTDKTGRQLSKVTPYQFALMPEEPVVAQTMGALPYLEYGLGSDRLGGAKMGYLDTLVRLQVTGKFNDEYRVQLAPDLHAFIPEDNVQLLPPGTFIPSSLTSNWAVWGDSLYDYVKVHLSQRLPYRSAQLTDPSRITVDIFGATSNTNWILQYQNVKEISHVFYEQAADHVVRMTIGLKHSQQWGYQIYYEGNDLILKVKRQPPVLSLDHLTIAIDAGHGGSNYGAMGPTGSYEKNVTLLIAKEVQDELKKAGAHVVMTRTTDVSLGMIDRNLMLRRLQPDLMLSIHLNAAADPIHVEGTSTYYRYIGFRPLSLAIYKRMIALGLGEYGNVGNFNFALNGPTEYPNALVETLFLSNPADEARALDPAFRRKMAGAIVQGIEDFLRDCAEVNDPSKK